MSELSVLNGLACEGWWLETFSNKSFHLNQPYAALGLDMPWLMQATSSLKCEAFRCAQCTPRLEFGARSCDIDRYQGFPKARFSRDFMDRTKTSRNPGYASWRLDLGRQGRTAHTNKHAIRLYIDTF